VHAGPMSEQNNEPAGPRPPVPDPPAPAHGRPGPPPPYQPGPPQRGGPTRPMPQWYPAIPRRPFRERTTKLWLALVAGLVCLAVGLGVGIAIGRATGHDDPGPGEFGRFPGGPGFRHHDGQRFGRGDRPALPNRSRPPLPETGPGATG